MFYNLSTLLYKFFNLYKVNAILSQNNFKRENKFTFKENLLDLNLNINKYLITPNNLKLSNLNSLLKIKN